MAELHTHEPRPEPKRLRRLALWIIVPFAALTALAMIVLWPTDVPHSNAAPAQEYRGVIASITDGPCSDFYGGGPVGNEPTAACKQAIVQVNRDGQTIEVQAAVPTDPGVPAFNQGDQVVVTWAGPESDDFTLADHQRSAHLWVLAVGFVLAVVAFGRMRGVRALIGLAVTFVVLAAFVVPGILAGQSPLLMAIVGSAAIVLAVLYITHGFSLITTVAVLGTLAALMLTGGLAAIAIEATKLSGISDDSSAFLNGSHAIDMRGLLLAAIVIGSLGVLDDITVTQSVTVAELGRANPDSSFRELYLAGTRVGRSHVASVINTIILAYAGTSLPLLVLLVAYTDDLGGVLSGQTIGLELVRSMVATIGLIAAVPTPTGLATFFTHRLLRGPQQPSDRKPPSAQPFDHKPQLAQLSDRQPHASPFARPS